MTGGFQLTESVPSLYTAQYEENDWAIAVPRRHFTHRKVVSVHGSFTARVDAQAG